MNHFDDELRRVLGDERLALTPRADAVARIVKGARRRRTARVVATAAGSVGLVAAVTVGSFAVSGQFSAGPDAVEPVQTPSVATGDPAPTPDRATSTPPATEPIVVYPNEGIDGFTVGTTLSDLEKIDGVEITRFSPEDGYSEFCYGEYHSARAHGYISTRGAFGVVPEDLAPYYEVSVIYFDVPVVTPEGITAGSSRDDVLAAYPSAAQFSLGDRFRAQFEGEQNVVRAWEFPALGDVVTEVVMDGLPACDRVPILDPPAGGDDNGDEGSG